MWLTSFRIGVMVLAIGMAVGTGARADTFQCPGSDFAVIGGGPRSEAICRAAETARDQLAGCHLPVERAMVIEVASELPEGCLGQYHCGEDRIKLGDLDQYGAYLSGTSAPLFRHLAPDVFFESLLRHELAHAALENMPCAFESCPAGQEFIAYAMQIWFLPAADRAPFDRRVEARATPVDPDRLNAFILAMAPDRFIESACAFLSAREDPCGLVADVAQGKLVLDMAFQ